MSVFKAMREAAALERDVKQLRRMLTGLEDANAQILEENLRLRLQVDRDSEEIDKLREELERYERLLIK